MSKSDKRLRRLCSSPSPKDFSWEEVETIMKAANFKSSCAGGSHYMFEHITGLKVGISKTHPAGILKQYQIDDVKNALVRVGYLGAS